MINKFVFFVAIFVQPLPPSEEKELKESLHEILAEENKVKLEQKVRSFVCTSFSIFLPLVYVFDYVPICLCLLCESGVITLTMLK